MARYSENDIVCDSINPWRLLVVERYFKGLYYCRLFEDIDKQALVYFEYELVPHSQCRQSKLAGNVANMKTLVIFFAALLAISFAGYGQDTVAFVQGRSQWNIGLKAGINFSSAYALPDAFAAKPTVNFAGGLFMEIPLCRSLSLQPEVLFSTRGIKGTGTSPTNPYSFTRTTSHIDVPVLLVIKPARFLSLLAGPQFSYLLRHHDSFSSGAPATRDEFDREPIRKTNVAVVIGADFIVHHLVFSTRLGWDVMPSTNSSTDLTPRYKYVWYQATLGYTLF